MNGDFLTVQQLLDINKIHVNGIYFTLFEVYMKKRFLSKIIMGQKSAPLLFCIDKYYSPVTIVSTWFTIPR